MCERSSTGVARDETGGSDWAGGEQGIRDWNVSFF